MENEEKKKLKALLEQNYVWPAPYQFKFIVKKEMLEEIQELLCPPEFEVVTKESRKGNYISVTAVKLILKSEDVLEVYRRVKVVKGVISI